MRYKNYLVRKSLIGRLLIGLLVITSLIAFFNFNFLPKITRKENDSRAVNYFNMGYDRILKIGKRTNWYDKKYISLLPIYANSILESRIEIPIEIKERFPEIYDFILGYIAGHTGELSTAKNFFNDLKSRPKFKEYGNTGLLELDSYTKNIISLCKNVKSFKETALFSSQAYQELLTDYELECLVNSGEYETAKKIIDQYKFNDINDKYKKNITNIELTTLAGKYKESKRLIDDTNKWYGNTEELVISEAEILALSDGYTASTKFLKENLKETSFFVKQEYAFYLVYAENSNRVEALKILMENANNKPFDVNSQLTLANYSFDYGFKKQLNDSYETLRKINNINEFSRFNLLEAKLALWKKNTSEVNQKLKLIEDKFPLDKNYLWFAYQYYDFIGQSEIALQFQKKYLLLEPNNQNLKNLLKNSNN